LSDETVKQGRNASQSAHNTKFVLLSQLSLPLKTQWSNRLIIVTIRETAVSGNTTLVVVKHTVYINVLVETVVAKNDSILTLLYMQKKVKMLFRFVTAKSIASALHEY